MTLYNLMYAFHNDKAPAYSKNNTPFSSALILEWLLTFLVAFYILLSWNLPFLQVFPSMVSLFQADLKFDHSVFDSRWRRLHSYTQVLLGSAD